MLPHLEITGPNYMTLISLLLFLFTAKLSKCQRIVKTKYDTIRYNVVYLACSKKLTCSQLSQPDATSRRIKEKRTKNKSRSMISPVRSQIKLFDANASKENGFGR